MTGEKKSPAVVDQTWWHDLSDEEVYAAWQLCEDTSPGPWEYEEGDPEGGIEDEDGYSICHIQQHGSLNSVLRTGEQYSHADARFVAASREIMPRALQMIRRLQEENKRLQALHELETGRAHKAEGELFYKTLSEVTERVELDHEVRRLQEALDQTHPDPWYQEKNRVWADHGPGCGADLICLAEAHTDSAFMVEAKNVLPSLLARLQRPVHRDDPIKRITGNPDHPVAVYLHDGTKIAIRRDNPARVYLEISRVQLCPAAGITPPPEGEDPDGTA